MLWESISEIVFMIQDHRQGLGLWSSVSGSFSSFVLKGHNTYDYAQLQAAMHVMWWW